MKHVLLTVVCLLSGCSMFNPMGVADYVVKPAIIDGQAMCCEVEVYNTKDIANVHVEMEKHPDGTIKLYLYEEQADASTPATAGADANRATAEALQGVIQLLPGIK